MCNYSPIEFNELSFSVVSTIQITQKIAILIIEWFWLWLNSEILKLNYATEFRFENSKANIEQFKNCDCNVVLCAIFRTIMFEWSRKSYMATKGRFKRTSKSLKKFILFFHRMFLLFQIFGSWMDGDERSIFVHTPANFSQITLCHVLCTNILVFIRFHHIATQNFIIEKVKKKRNNNNNKRELLYYYSYHNYCCTRVGTEEGRTMDWSIGRIWFC